MPKTNTTFNAYLKFSGPSVNEGQINVGKIGNSLIALNRIFNKYHNISTKGQDCQFELKLKGLKKGSTEVQIIIEQILPTVQPVAQASTAYLFLKAIGITEFGKQFFSTLAEQIVLKMFSKGKRLKEEKTFVKNQTIYIKLINIDGDEKEIPLKNWDNYKLLYPDSKGLVQLEPYEKMSIGYEDEGRKHELVTIAYQEKVHFDSNLEQSIEDKEKDPFDDQNAESIKIVGRFIDFYGLARKYPFAFQARKQQNKIGKQKILCMVNPYDISKLINYLKPEKSVDLYIYGKATKDFEGKIDKIKIEWFSESPEFNPDQIDISY